MSKTQRSHKPTGLSLQTRKVEAFFWSPFEIERQAVSDVKIDAYPSKSGGSNV